MDAAEVARNGWTAVPVDAAKLWGGKPYRNQPGRLLVDDVAFPSDDPIVAQVQEYAKAQLPPQTFNHSMRIFYYGMAILKQQFPEHASSFSPSTLALTCLLHDIGTTAANLAATRMSFEFHGAITALHLLAAELGAPRDQAEAVAESIIRHQDLGTEGTITLLGQIIQLATIYDNVGSHRDIPGFAGLLHDETRADVNARFARDGWLGCFAKTIKAEVEAKPWCHTTHIPKFEKLVLENGLMRPYE